MDIPHYVTAYGWIPFVAVIVLTLFISWIYIAFYKCKYETDCAATIASILAISVALLSSFLVPVDVFLVSFMKNSNGTYKDWANDTNVRESIESTILCAYYAFYGVILAFVFVILPFVYFFHEEKDIYANGASRLCTAFKFTLVFVIMAGALILMGALIPWKKPPANNGSDFEFIIDELKSNTGEDIMSFIMSVLTSVGIVIFLLYGGYGMAALPFELIKGSRSARSERADVRDRQAVLAARRAALNERYSSGRESAHDRNAMQEIEEQERLLNRQDRHLEAAASSCLNKCCILLRPFEVVIGIVMAAFGLLIFLSLLLTNIDKIMHSLGMKSGYILPERKLPNPIDMIFVQAQKVFPLDYLLFLGIVLFLLLCAMTGVRRMGIWFLWIRMFRIRPHRTRPQGQLLLSMTIVFAVLAINIFMYSLTVQYFAYGSQKYWGSTSNSTNATITLMNCNTEAPPDECTLTRISMLITRFCYKAWVFGAFYYWSIWAFLGIVVLGSIVAIVKRRRSAIDGAVDPDDFDESDDELIVV